VLVHQASRFGDEFFSMAEVILETHLELTQRRGENRRTNIRV
jgi:hypothetical protein